MADRPLPRLGPFHPAQHAAVAPARPAVVMAGSGAVVTYGDLAARSARLGRALAARGVGPGAHVALLLDNSEHVFEACWAALRVGLRCTPISTWLNPEEAASIAQDAGAVALVASSRLADTAAGIGSRVPGLRVRLALGGPIEGFERYEAAVDGLRGDPLDEEPEGAMMFYSSGTTGRPKGIERPFSGEPAGTSNPLAPFLPLVGLAADSVYLSPAPLYHAAPLGWSLGVQRLGGTVIVMEHFDPAGALEAIERHRVTHAQFVPTMFVRLLKLPPAVRVAHDLSSLRKVVHAGAPCAVEVKSRVIDWLGPIVDEYYSGSEGSGITYVTAQEWLARPGTVGRPILGTVHITGEDGAELPPGEVGTVWFGGGGTYEYHRDAAGTAARRHPQGWTTLDDVGYLDEDGYLFLTDRRAHMIVSGGVNVSPQEAEDALTLHPAVDDVAVVGVPDPDLGEVVRAVVVPAAGVVVGPALEAELLAHCRDRLARYKCPKAIDFAESLPRLATGKLAKHVLKARYWVGHDTRII